MPKYLGKLADDLVLKIANGYKWKDNAIIALAILVKTMSHETSWVQIGRSSTNGTKANLLVRPVAAGIDSSDMHRYVRCAIFIELVQL